MDQAFGQVIHHCADLRIHSGQGTWLVQEMIEAYTRLHEKGFAHSVEAWKEGHLAGGLYGIALGGCFFGESMFSTMADSSKTALAALDRHLVEQRFDLIDCQVRTDHLVSMGGVEIPRKDFLARIHGSLEKRTVKGPWTFTGF